MLPALTSLRFVFAAMVFTHHLTALRGSRIYDGVFAEGYIGVSFFFILSGFVLTLSYRPGHLRLYYWKRFARVYPNHLFTFFLALPLTFHGMRTMPEEFPWWALLPNLFLLQAFLPIRHLIFSNNYLSWSLSAEAFFYGLFPLLHRLTLRAIFGTAVLFALGTLALSFTHSLPESLEHPWFYTQPLTRVFDFLLGIGLAKGYLARPSLSRRPATRAQWASLALLALFFAAHAWVPQLLRYGIYYWIPMGAVIWAFAHSEGAVARRLAYRPWVLLGELSFAFYLLHQLGIRYLDWALEAGGWKLGTLALYGLYGLLFLVTLGLSYALFRGWEQPVRRWLLDKGGK